MNLLGFFVLVKIFRVQAEYPKVHVQRCDTAERSTNTNDSLPYKALQSDKDHQSHDSSAWSWSSEIHCSPAACGRLKFVDNKNSLLRGTNAPMLPHQASWQAPTSCLSPGQNWLPSRVCLFPLCYLYSTDIWKDGAYTFKIKILNNYATQNVCYNSLCLISNLIYLK